MSNQVHLDRRAFLRGAGATLLAAAGSLGLASCGVDAPMATGPDSGDDMLRVGYLPITDAAPLLVAHADHHYADEGLDVARPTAFRSWAQIAEAFQSRQIDLAHLLMPMAIWLRFAQNQPLKVVAWNHTGGSALTVRKDITDVRELAGRRVAVPFWYSIHNVAIQSLLRAAQLTPVLAEEPSEQDGTVQLLVMAPPDMPPALATGNIAGYIVADPFNAAAELQDIGHILRFTGDVWLNHACCVAVMHEDALHERPQWTQRTINALVAAQHFCRHNRDQSARLLTARDNPYLPQDTAHVQAALSEYAGDHMARGVVEHPEWTTQRIDFQPFPFASYTTELIRQLRHTTVEGDRSFLADLEPQAAHETLVDDSFVRRAIAANGGPAAFGLPQPLTRREIIDV